MPSLLSDVSVPLVTVRLAAKALLDARWEATSVAFTAQSTNLRRSFVSS